MITSSACASYRADCLKTALSFTNKVAGRFDAKLFRQRIDPHAHLLYQGSFFQITKKCNNSRRELFIYLFSCLIYHY